MAAAPACVKAHDPLGKDDIFLGESLMPIMRSTCAALLAALALAGCSNIGNMFGSSSPDLVIEGDKAPNVKDLRRAKPEGLLPDKDNARRSGESLRPQ
jgi:hypothetical protein